ncbi:putative ABC transport system substrate-binding protein [Bradyrhizobium algeriense]|jgi:putative ABC transport system substrate-binding protein|uniref:ABC transport system substrate-binding protein n=1 Tax=Bradyrhizobium algeriense TaxID=634784 RepID=A0ABU8BQ08_9BRAD
MFDIRRRQFITLLGGAAAWPLAAGAQQSAMPLIGLLSSDSAESYAGRLTAIRRGLEEIGYTEGQNVTIEYRWAEGQYDRIPGLVVDLLRHRLAVIAADGTTAARAAQAATTVIPIVFLGGDDPIRAGLVSNLNRPAANVTGVTLLNVTLGPKRLELLHEMLPDAAIITLFINRNSPVAELTVVDMQYAARTLGLQLDIHAADIAAEHDIDVAFENLAKTRKGPLLIGADAFLVSRSEQLGALAFRHAIPAILSYREFVAAGGLMSYAASRAEVYRQGGTYLGRILKGAQVSDLPVLQPTRFELIINGKTAKALGLTVPAALLSRADEVIE